MPGDHSSFFPVSVILAGFCVMSGAYLICFCCCIVQFFMRRGNNNQQSATNQGIVSSGFSGQRLQKNDKLKAEFWKRFQNSLKRFKKEKRPPLQMVMSCELSCPICFDEYDGNPAEILIGYIKTCGHYFHFNCIWLWLEYRQSCPICRNTTRLTESDIKGIALRHVAEYQKSIMAESCQKSSRSDESVQSNILNETDVPAPEQGVEVHAGEGGTHSNIERLTVVVIRNDVQNEAAQDDVCVPIPDEQGASISGANGQQDGRHGSSNGHQSENGVTSSDKNGPKTEEAMPSSVSTDPKKDGVVSPIIRNGDKQMERDNLTNQIKMGGSHDNPAFVNGDEAV